MSTTTQAGTVHSIFGIDSIDAAVSAIVGDFHADYDTNKLGEMITADREALLPNGWTIHGDIVIRDVDAPDLPENWRESILDAGIDVDPEDARISPMQVLVNANAAEHGFTPHVWTVGREIRTCRTCGTREAYWDDEEYPINPCKA